MLRFSKLDRSWMRKKFIIFVLFAITTNGGSSKKETSKASPTTTNTNETTTTTHALETDRIFNTRLGFDVKESGTFELRNYNDGVKFGQYVFDQETMKVKSKFDNDDEFVESIFQFDRISNTPLPDSVQPSNIPIGIVDSSIGHEISLPTENELRVFVLPSQLNGAEYPSDTNIVKHIWEYLHDGTGGPRGQLAVNPGIGQFILDHAESDQNPQGINGVRDFLKSVRDSCGDLKLQNGYLKYPNSPEIMSSTTCERKIVENLHLIRVPQMLDAAANGLNPDLQSFSDSLHKVNMVYASSTPTDAYGNADTDFGHELAYFIRISQYLSALNTALKLKEQNQNKNVKVFFMPLGAGVFRNRMPDVIQSMLMAVDLSAEIHGAHKIEQLDINVLTFNGNPDELPEVQENLRNAGRLK